MNSRAEVRQCPGWWSNLVEAICADCGWRGPTRDVYQPTGRSLARMDAASHDCLGSQGEW